MDVQGPSPLPPARPRKAPPPKRRAAAQRADRWGPAPRLLTEPTLVHNPGGSWAWGDTALSLRLFTDPAGSGKGWCLGPGEGGRWGTPGDAQPEGPAAGRAPRRAGRQEERQSSGGLAGGKRERVRAGPAGMSGLWEQILATEKGRDEAPEKMGPGQVASGGGCPAGPGQGELGGGRWELGGGFLPGPLGARWGCSWRLNGSRAKCSWRTPLGRPPSENQNTVGVGHSAGNWSPAPCRQEQRTVQLPCEPAQWFLEERSEHCRRPRVPPLGTSGSTDSRASQHCPQQPWGEAAQRPSRDVGQTTRGSSPRQKDPSALKGRNP